MSKDYQIEEEFFIGNSLSEAEATAKSIGWSVYVVERNGVPNYEVRTQILRPYEVKLVLDKAGRVSKAYRIV
jgi:hypothetical protein